MNKAEEKEIDFLAQFDHYMNEINNIEYLKKHKIDVVVGNVKQVADEVEPEKKLIISAEYNNAKDTLVANASKTVDCTRIQMLVNGECLYMRTVEGITNESKYICAYYCYRDILNCGIQLTYLIWEDQKRILLEIAEKANATNKIGIA